MTHQDASYVPLEKMKDGEVTFADADQDIRGRRVVDQDGYEIGHVSALFIDVNGRRVRMLEIRAGGLLGLGERHFLLPVDAVTSIGKSRVQVNETRERIIKSPPYNPVLIVARTREYWEPFYSYYGHSPNWNMGYIHPSVLRSRNKPKERVGAELRNDLDRHAESKSGDPRRREDDGLEQMRRNVGENVSGFGELINDSDAAVIDRVLKEHPIHED